MAVFERGDMFSVWGKTDLFLFTSNPIVNKRGLAVMGRGIARQVADRYPLAQEMFGATLLGGYARNVGVLGKFDGQLLGWFRVKDHFAQQARTNIIEASVRHLSVAARGFARVDLNFPGIGNGGLPREEVLPLLTALPDNVHIWEFEEDTIGDTYES